MEINKIRWILLALLAVWMVVIFCMSAMDSEASDRLSMGVTEKVIVIVAPHYNELPETEQTGIMQKANFAIRKLTHFLEYAVLGILVWLVLLHYNKKTALCLLAAILICIAYAIGDEVHQIFVFDRSPQITDVLIDTSGSAVTIILLSLNARSKNQPKVNAAIEN